MMNNYNKLIGHLGEALACRYLEELGYTLVKHNYRIHRTEADLIFTYQDTLIIVEVKTRKSLSCGYGCEAITIRKQNDLRKFAQLYLQQAHLDCYVRFDVVDIVLEPNNKILNLTHLQNAF